MKAQAAAAPAHKPVQVKRSKDDQIFFLVSHIIVILLTLIVLYPLIYIISSSFSSANAVSTGQVVLLPVEPSVMGYQKVFENAKVWTGYKNTLIYTVLGTLLNVFMTLICAYPLARRGALCLAQSGFSEDEIAKIAGRSAAQFACASTPEAASAREAVSSIVFAEDDADAMNDEIYARFEERSVGVENKIHDIRIRFDQIAPYLALAVLAIFAVAVYVSFKMAG